MCRKQVHHGQVRLQVHTPKAGQVLLRMAVAGFIEAEVGRAVSTGAGAGAGAWELIKVQYFLHQTLSQIHPPAV